MAYCAYTDVQAIISTTLVQAQIEAIIAESDAEIDLRLGSQTAGDKVIQKLSKLMTAIQIKTRQPTAMAAGEYRETHDPIAVWAAEVLRLFEINRAGKIRGTPYEHIDEDARYTEDVREPGD
jgi:hypothetical protein